MSLDMNPAAPTGNPADPDTLTPRLITFPEAAKFFSVSERHLRNLVARGEIPCCRLGRSIRFSPAQITAWIDSQAALRTDTALHPGKDLATRMPSR